MIAPSPEPSPAAEPPPARAADLDDEEVILSVRGVSKHYKLWSSPSVRLRYSLLSQTHRTLRGVLPKESAPLKFVQRRRERLYQDFTALHNLSFEVRRGESLGIIGRNGSGKSTLLQIIAGTLRPSTGHVDVYGRIAALLELGSGFNPEFTGVENIYLNASILGLSEEETNAKFDAIAAFADIGRFLDQPVKTYSSGMMLRLAFAVSINVEPDILIIDEALSVGDIYFQSKCNKQLTRKLDDGLTLLLVSHSSGAIRAMCQRGLVLDLGRYAFLGPSDQAVNIYHELGDRQTAKGTAEAEESGEDDEAPLSTAAPDLPPIGKIEDEIGNREMLVTGCGLYNEKGQLCRDFAGGEPIRATFSFVSNIDTHDLLIGFLIRDPYGAAVTALTSVNQRMELPPVHRGGKYTVSLLIPGRLGAGDYLLDFGIGAHPSPAGSPELHYHRIGGIASFTVNWFDRRVRFQGTCDVGAEFRWVND